MPLRLLVIPVVLIVAIFGQGRCRNGYATPGCPLSRELATARIKPVFPATGWKTVALDHITFLTPDYRREAAFYSALMGWKLRSDDGNQAILDVGDWGSAVFTKARGGKAVVQSICWVIEPWDKQKVYAELKSRGLSPTADDGPGSFESFHIKDPNGFDLQISNGNGLAKARSRQTTATSPAQSGWNTVWLDHLSYNATNYKQTASFYTNLLGWQETYDEGSQHELLIGEIGNIIIRGGSPSTPSNRIDHISFGIAPWNTDAVKAELAKRKLSARLDAFPKGDIKKATFKSFHTRTPNGFDLQISSVSKESRLALANAVKP